VSAAHGMTTSTPAAAAMSGVSNIHVRTVCETNTDFVHSSLGMLYSYSFEQNPDWTREYPGQEEILVRLSLISTSYYKH